MLRSKTRDAHHIRRRGCTQFPFTGRRAHRLSLRGQLKGSRIGGDTHKLAIDRCAVLVSRHFRNTRDLFSWKKHVDEAKASAWLRTIVPHDSCEGLISRDESAVYMRYSTLLKYITAGAGGDRTGRDTFERWWRARGYRKAEIYLVSPSLYDNDVTCLRVPLEQARGDILLQQIETLEQTIIKEYIPNGTIQIS